MNKEKIESFKEAIDNDCNGYIDKDLGLLSFNALVFIVGQHELMTYKDREIERLKEENGNQRRVLERHEIANFNPWG